MSTHSFKGEWGAAASLADSLYLNTKWSKVRSSWPMPYKEVIVCVCIHHPLNWQPFTLSSPHLCECRQHSSTRRPASSWWWGKVVVHCSPQRWPLGCPGKRWRRPWGELTHYPPLNDYWHVITNVISDAVHKWGDRDLKAKWPRGSNLQRVSFGPSFLMLTSDPKRKLL